MHGHTPIYHLLKPMNNRLVIGQSGEERAALFLQEQGYEIVQKNYRHQKFEIDIIALKQNVLHFVEVKTRQHKMFGEPIEAITREKIQHIKQAANEFLHTTTIPFVGIQFDAIGIVMKTPTQEEELVFIEDLF